MAVGAPRSSGVLHRVSGRSRPGPGFLSSLWLDNLGARVLVVLACGGVGFSCCSFPIRPFWSSFCLAAAGSRGVGKTSPRIADLPGRGGSVCIGFMYLEGSAGGQYMERSRVEIGVTKWVQALPLDVWAGVVGCEFGCRPFQPLRGGAVVRGWRPRACGELSFI